MYRHTYYEGIHKSTDYQIREGELEIELGGLQWFFEPK